MNILVNDDFLEFSGEKLQRLIDSLPAWRREQTMKFKFEQGRRECALSYKMLTDCLCNEYGITEPQEFILGEHGKPTLKYHPEIHFNISHCKNAIAVAVSDQPVGIDVECINRYNDGVARYAMSDEELNTILSSDNKELEFIRLWTKKEALLKLTGEGINDDIKSVLKDTHGIKISTEEHLDKSYIISIAT